MTQIDQAETWDAPHAQPENESSDEQQELSRGRQRSQQSEEGGHQGERAISIAAGSILTLLGLSRASGPGLIVAGVGGVMIYRGAMGTGFGKGRAHASLATRGIHVTEAYLVNRPADELYQFWRNFENLPRIMTHVESVTVSGDRRSHWVVHPPRLTGKLEWDAEITRDEPNQLISWQSLAGADVDNAGEIRFSKAMGDRGTEVRVSMRYLPPAGRLGHWLATMLGESAERLVREDLRNFKRLMECGEIPTIEGQPHGACAGWGFRQKK